MTFRILVTGSREWTQWGVVEAALRDVHLRLSRGCRPADVTVVHGGARGADTIAGLLADRMGFQVEVHPADWDRYGRSAGHRRNAEMVKLGADACIAFPIGSSPGTRGCMRLAATAGIPVKVYTA